MYIKEAKGNTLLIFIVSAVLVFLISIALSYLTMYFAEQTGEAISKMVEFVYAAGTLVIGIISVLGYLGVVVILILGFVTLLEHNDTKGK